MASGFATAVLLCIGIIGLGIPVPFLIQPLTAIVASLLIGLSGGLNDTLWNTLQQEHVPSEKLGRVSSINMLSSFCLWPLGYAIVGKVADTIDPGWVFVITGCIGIVLYSCALFRRSIRQLE